jgi:hypothetical protein
MRVAIDGEEASCLAGPAREFWIEVKSSWIGIDFQRGAGRRSSCENRVPVESSAFTALDQSTRRMGDDIDIGVRQDPL